MGTGTSPVDHAGDQPAERIGRQDSGGRKNLPAAGADNFNNTEGKNANQHKYNELQVRGNSALHALPGPARQTFQHDLRFSPEGERALFPGTRGALPSPEVPPRLRASETNRRRAVRNGSEAQSVPEIQHKTGLGQREGGRDGVHPSAKAVPAPRGVQRSAADDRGKSHSGNVPPGLVLGSQA